MRSGPRRGSRLVGGSSGLVTVAYGDKARAAAQTVITSASAHTPNLPLAVVSDAPLAGADHLPFADPRWGARWAKLNLDRLTPFDHTLYLDADTEVLADLSAVFGILADGWELVIAPSGRQGRDSLGHLPGYDLAHTLAALDYSPLNLQAGVFAFRRGRAITKLFAAWRDEWLRFEEYDQGALLRALETVPVRVWLLGRCWNGGDLVAHHFGRV